MESQNKLTELEKEERWRVSRFAALVGLKGRWVYRCDTVWDMLWVSGDEGGGGR